LTDADHPGSAVGLRPHDTDVAGEIDEAVTGSDGSADLRGAVCGILLG
jgi:hypothetical protein